MQWGVPKSLTTAVTLPIAFTASIFAVIAVDVDNNADNIQTVSTSWNSSESLKTITILPIKAVMVSYIAIGK